MKTIWKYLLGPEAYLEMPKGAKILSVGTQEKTIGQEEACLWALVDPKEEKEMRVFTSFGTGHEIPDKPGTYVGSFMFKRGILVFHVFER